MSWTENWLTPEPAAPTLRELALRMADDAIVYRTADFAFCHDCECAADGLCHRHRDDSALADDYQAIRKEIADGDVLALGSREPPP
jgi:hypothetical protein